jgi:predicted HicB family RNase H-like nuclease
MQKLDHQQLELFPVKQTIYRVREKACLLRVGASTHEKIKRKAKASGKSIKKLIEEVFND